MLDFRGVLIKTRFLSNYVWFFTHVCTLKSWPPHRFWSFSFLDQSCYLTGLLHFVNKFLQVWKGSLWSQPQPHPNERSKPKPSFGQAIFLAKLPQTFGFQTGEGIQHQPNWRPQIHRIPTGFWSPWDQQSAGKALVDVQNAQHFWNSLRHSCGGINDM